MTDLLGHRDIPGSVLCQIEQVEVGFLVALRVLRVQDMATVGRGIPEIVSLIADCKLDGPTARARDTPDIVSAGNIRLEIEMLTVNRPAKSEHGTRIVESVNIQRTISRAGRASDRVAGQFGSGGGDHLIGEVNPE